MSSMIKGIILDIDGVIVGEKVGLNSPYPHEQVLAKLRSIRNRGIPITLCTAKPHFSIDKIVLDAGLNNMHITDGGAVIINPLTREIVEEHNLDTNISIQIIQVLIANNVYTEFYTANDYFIQRSQQNFITPQHVHILQKDPILVDDLRSEANKQKITKIMPIALDVADKTKVATILSKWDKLATISWGIHPVALPLQFGIVTALGISKKESTISVAKLLGIKLTDYLGVGDSLSDWQFIEICGQGAAMGNAAEDLKQLVTSKGKGKWYIGSTVNENGIINILDYFIK